MKLLVSYKADINSHNQARSRVTIFQAAVQKHRKEMMDYLVAAKADINGVDAGRQTAVIHTSWCCEVASLKYLLSIKASTELRDNSGRTALMGAAGNGNFHAVILLLEHSLKDLEITDNGGMTALMHAVRLAKRNIAKYLIKSKAVVDKTDLHSLGTLGWAARSGDLSVVKLLVEEGKASLDLGSSPLTYAAHAGFSDITEYLVDAKSDIEATIGRGWTIAMSAARENKLEVLKILLSKKANLEDLDDDRWSLANHSMHRGAEDVVKLLLEKGVDFNHKSQLGSNPIHAAARGGFVNCLKMVTASAKEPGMKRIKHFLLFNSHLPWGKKIRFENILQIICLFASPETPENLYQKRFFDGATPLMLASANKRVAAVEFFVRERVPLLQRNQNKRTALDAVEQFKTAETREAIAKIQSLLTSASLPRRQCSHKIKAGEKICDSLMKAVENEHVSCVRFMLRHKADANYKTRNYGKSEENNLPTLDKPVKRKRKKKRFKTALEMAKEMNNDKILEILQKELQKES